MINQFGVHVCTNPTKKLRERHFVLFALLNSLLPLAGLSIPTDALCESSTSEIDTRKKIAVVGKAKAELLKGNKAHPNRFEVQIPIKSGVVGKQDVVLKHLENPKRVLVELSNVSAEPKFQRLAIKNSPWLKSVRLGTDEKTSLTRLVLDVGKEQSEVQVLSGKETLRVVLSKVTTVAATESEKTAQPQTLESQSQAQISQAIKPTSVSTPQTQTKVSRISNPEETQTKALIDAALAEEKNLARVKDAHFDPKDGFVRFTVRFDRPLSALKIQNLENGSKPELRISNTILPPALAQALDVNKVAGNIVSSITTLNEGNTFVIRAELARGTEARHWSKDTELHWDFRNLSAKVSLRAEAAPYFPTATSAPGDLSSILMAAPKYKGRRITLDVKDADIRNVLRLLADVSQLNIVASDDVQGKVTIKLKNVPWDQALDIILKSKQLDKVRSGNIIRIAPLEVIRAEEQARIERNKAKVELEPLTVRLIPVSYAIGAEIKPQVEALLSARGKVNIDKRTNVLIVEDIPEQLLKIERLVRTLDTQTPQVLIEARIVEAQSTFERTLGVQWGGQVSMTQQFGTSTGLAFPNQFRVGGGSDDQATQGTNSQGVLTDPNYAVNLPAPVGTGRGGSIGFILGNAGGSALLNLRLSAAETTGNIKIISSPKVVTLDNKKANILSGEKIPITVITANGPSTRFLNANIELSVTPHVTQDGSILMEIEATKNELSGRTDLLGVPGIFTKEARTEMIVRDGDTAVLGGLYRRTERENKSFVPLLGRIPVLGWLFKTTSRRDDRDELLIFISPRIVNRSQALVQQ